MCDKLDIWLICELMCEKIVNLNTVKDLQKWIQDEINIYIGRRTKKLQASKWANPYKIQKPVDRETVVLLYKRHLQGSGLFNCIDELKGKTLGCWCSPKLSHGVVCTITQGTQQWTRRYAKVMKNMQFLFVILGLPKGV